MIDEFQDTSSKQYENFKGLIRESLAGGHFNMLIGDAKQSIYRFRNADPTVFRDKVEKDFKDDITGSGPALPGDDPDKPSSVNYRSSSNIIDFNNSLFLFMRDIFGGANGERKAVINTYADIKQGKPDDIDTDKVPGYVRLITGNYAACTHDAIISETLPPDYTAPDEKSDDDVLTILPGYLLELHQRYDWKDIGILVNKNKEGDQVVEAILDFNKRTTGEKIRIVSGESLLLSNSPIIRRIIAMLRFIDISQFGVAEDDDIDLEDYDSMASCLARKRESDRRLYMSLSRFIKAVSDHPDAEPQENGILLAQALDDSAASSNPDGNAASHDELLERLLPPAGELTTLVSIVETIIAYFKNGNPQQGNSPQNDVDREAAFLLAFQDAVMQFSSMRNGGSVREFLKYWDEKKATLAVNSSTNDDAIQIMSIHKAKGLEFNCVVIPFADWELDGNSREVSYWMPSDIFLEVLQSICGNQTPKVNEIDVPPLLHVDKASTVALFENGRLGKEASAFVGKQIDDVLIDNLNKTYVAMTRPRNELHVFARGKENSVATPLAMFARDGGLMTAIPQFDGWYELGVMPRKEDFEAVKEAKRRKNALKPGRDHKRKVSHEAMKGYTVNDLPLELKVNVEHASSSRIKAGIRLHSLLSRIHDRNDVDRVFTLGLKHGTLTDDDTDACGIKSFTEHVVNPIKDSSTRVAAWFDPENMVYSERTVSNVNEVDEDGNEIKNLRPDRIIRRPDGTMLVIDYKSGRRRDRKNCSQVQRYIKNLRLVFPDTPIAGRIWYVTHDLIIDENGKTLDFGGVATKN